MDFTNGVGGIDKYIIIYEWIASESEIFMASVA